MAVATKTIKRRIKSVANTRKITKAQELVSASKVRRAVSGVLASRPYARQAWSLVAEIAQATGISEEESHPLLKPPAHRSLGEGGRPTTGRALAVIYTSDRGLCGGFNVQVTRMASEYIARRPQGNVDIVAVGKRAEQYARRQGLKLLASFPGLVANPTSGGSRPLARLLTQVFTKGDYDEVAIIYNDFISAIVQKPRAKILLPIRRDANLGTVIPPGEPVAGPDRLSGGSYLFEPSPAVVLDALLPRIVESQVYQALLESVASEHSARMLAMRNASDAASDMLDDLNFTYNQARQAGITPEIAEISAGTAAIAQ